MQLASRIKYNVYVPIYAKTPLQIEICMHAHFDKKAIAAGADALASLAGLKLLILRRPIVLNDYNRKGIQNIIILI